MLSQSNESIGGEYILDNKALNVAINEWHKDIKVLVSLRPRSVMCGYIRCAIDCLQLLANGSVKIHSLRCLDSTGHSDYHSLSPSTPYHLLIPSSDIHDWYYSDRQEFSLLMFGMKKDSVLRVKCALGLSDGFSRERRYIMCLLDTPLDRNPYSQFASLLLSNGVQIHAIDETKTIVSYNCSSNGQSLSFPTTTTPAMIDTNTDSSQKQMALTTSSSLATDISLLMSRLLSGKFAPKRCQFGAYECFVSDIEFTAFKDIKFFNVKQQTNDTKERFETIAIEMTDIESVFMCLDVNLPSIFLKVNPICGKKIQIALHLRPKASNQLVFDINSRTECERYVKVLFNDYKHHNWCFLNLLMYARTVHRRSPDHPVTTNISIQKARQLLESHISSI